MNIYKQILSEKSNVLYTHPVSRAWLKVLSWPVTRGFFFHALRVRELINHESIGKEERYASLIEKGENMRFVVCARAGEMIVDLL